MRAIELEKDDEYDSLTVVGVTRRGGVRVWECRCVCGSICYQKASELRSGSAVSCGCKKRGFLIRMNTTHGDTGSAEYKAWENMKTRCYNSDSPYFGHYGGRGIKVCERWLDSFQNFLEDMGRRPSERYSLDRFPDNDGDYRPGNCRWATQKQQLRNRRGNVLMTVGGVTKTLAEWSEDTGICSNTLKYRLKVGWKPEDVIGKMPNRKRW